MVMIDIDMPDNCDEFRFNTEYDFCKAMPDNFCGNTDDRKRPKWCPLKEQEARVMTLDEVKAFNWDYCYLEEERLPGKEYRLICGNYALTCITWPCIASMRIQHGDDSYGKKWRCWSAKPSDEQRKAIKWE